MLELAVLTLASLFAGFVDAIGGGGGLVLVPALFGAFPGAAPATLFGTNKGASIWGTGWATLQYARRVQLPWSALWPAALSALVGSAAGAWCVTVIDPGYFRKALPVVLLGVLLYTVIRKNFGQVHAPRYQGRKQAVVASAVGVIVGAYDGFFGPGTGSFLVFLFVRLLGFDFLHASASAKFLNTATNAAALVLFACKGHVWWQLAGVMALANVIGSLIGTRLALRHGAPFVRVVFVGVVLLLIVKTAWDGFFRSG
jgi:uncharacterized membrane protein YfcA